MIGHEESAEKEAQLKVKSNKFPASVFSVEGAIQRAFPMGNQTLALRETAVSQEEVMKQLEKDKCSELPGADGVNLRGLIGINYEIAEIVTRSFHVL